MLKKEDFERGLLGEGGEVDRRSGGNEFEVASNGGAADTGKGATEDKFEGFSFDSGLSKVMLEVVEDGTGDLGGEGPCGVASLGGRFFDGQDEPVFAEARRGASWNGDQRKGDGDGFFSGHLSF